MFAVRSLRLFAIVIAAVLIASHSIAVQMPPTQQVCFTASTPLQQMNWQTAIPVPKFDPLLGALQQIDLSFTSTVNESVQVESLDSSITVVSVDLGIYLTLVRPNFAVLATIAPSAHNQFAFSPFDGTIDYGGTSGGTWSPTSTTTATATSPPPASDLALFTGLPGNPGTIALMASATNSISVSGTANIAYVSSGQADAMVQVCYTFQPNLAGVPYCFGDGSSAACPCGNVGAAGNGCPSSVNAAGANLSGTGTASIAADSFVLLGSGMPDSAALYFQGTTQIDAVFGDGKRCIGGTVIRLGTKVNSAGASQYPSGSDPLVSVKGAVTAGSMRSYQVWYRNADPAFCTPSTFNLTNGTIVTWMP
jgi:hypothetical protein